MDNLIGEVSVVGISGQAYRAREVVSAGVQQEVVRPEEVLNVKTLVSDIENELLTMIRTHGGKNSTVIDAIKCWATSTDNGHLATVVGVVGRNQLARAIDFCVAEAKMKTLGYMRSLIKGFLSRASFYTFNGRQHPWTTESTGRYLTQLLGTRESRVNQLYKEILSGPSVLGNKIFSKFFSDLSVSIADMPENSLSFPMPEDHLLQEISKPEFSWWAREESPRITAWKSGFRAERSGELFTSEEAAKELRGRFLSTNEGVEAAFRRHANQLANQRQTAMNQEREQYAGLGRQLSRLKAQWEALENSEESPEIIADRKESIREEVIATCSSSCLGIASLAARQKLIVSLEKLHDFHQKTPDDKLDDLIPAVDEVFDMVVDSMDELRTQISALITNLNSLIHSWFQLRLRTPLYVSATRRDERSDNTFEARHQTPLEAREFIALTKKLSAHVKEWLKPYLDYLVWPNYAESKKDHVEKHLCSLLVEIEKQLPTKTQDADPNCYDLDSAREGSIASGYVVARHNYYETRFSKNMLETPAVSYADQVMKELIAAKKVRLTALLDRAPNQDPDRLFLVSALVRAYEGTSLTKVELIELLNTGLPVRSRSRLLNALIRYADQGQDNDVDLFGLCVSLMQSGAKVSMKEGVSTLAYACQRAQKFDEAQGDDPITDEHRQDRWNLFLGIREADSLAAKRGWLDEYVTKMIKGVAEASDLPVELYQRRDAALLKQILFQILVSALFGLTSSEELATSTLGWQLQTLWSYLGSYFHTPQMCSDSERPCTEVGEWKIVSLLRYYGTPTFESRRVLFGDRVAVDVSALGQKVLAHAKEVLAHPDFKRRLSAIDEVNAFDLNRRLGALKSGELVNYNNQIRDREARNANKELKFRAKEADYRVQELQNEILEVDQATKRAVAACTQAQKIACDLKVRVEDLESRNSKLTEQSSRDRAELKQAKAGEAKAKAETVQLKEEVVQAKAGEAKAKAETVQLKGEVVRAKAGEAKAKAETVQLKEEVVQAKAGEAKAKAETVQLKEEVVQAKAETAHLKEEVVQARAREAKSKIELSREREIVAKLTSEKTLLQSEIFTLKQTVSDVTGDLKAEKMDHQETRNSLKVANGRISDLETENALLKSTERGEAVSARPGQQAPSSSGGPSRRYSLFDRVAHDQVPPKRAPAFE